MAIKPFQYQEVASNKPTPPVSTGGIEPFKYADTPVVQTPTTLPKQVEPTVIQPYIPGEIKARQEVISQGKPIQQAPKLSKVGSFLDTVTNGKYSKKIAETVVSAFAPVAKTVFDVAKTYLVKPKSEEQADIVKKFDEYNQLKQQATTDAEGNTVLPKETGSEALKRIVVEEKGGSAIPFLSGAIDIKNLVQVGISYKKLEDGTADEYDLMRLSNFVDENSRDKTMSAQVAEIVSGSLAFGGELLATAGIGAGAKTAAVKGTKEALEKIITKEGASLIKKKTAEMLLKKEVAPKLVGNLVKEAIRAPIAGATRTGASTIRNMLPQVDWNSIDKTDAGTYQGNITKEGDGVGLAFTKALGETYVETLSERAGDLFGLLGTGKVISDLASKTAIGNAFIKANLKIGATPAVKAFNEIVRKTGWNGVISEMLEEQVGSVGYGILQKLGLSDQGFKLPTKDELFTQLIAFSIPGTIVGLTQAGLGKFGKASDVSEAMDAINEDVQDALRSGNPESAKEALVNELDFTEDQADVIIENNREALGEDINPTIDLTALGEEALAEMQAQADESSAIDTSTEALEQSIDAILSGKTFEEVTQKLDTVDKKLSEIETLIKKQKEEGYSNFEIAEKLQKEYKMSIKEANDQVVKYIESTKEIKEETKIEPKKEEIQPKEVKEASEDIPQDYSKAVDLYKQVALTDTSKGKGALSSLIEEANTAEGRRYVTAQVKKLSKDKNGNILVYRVGSVRDGNMSVTLNKGTADVISQERAKQGLNSTITEMFVTPEQVKAVVPGIESELIISQTKEVSSETETKVRPTEEPKSVEEKPVVSEKRAKAEEDLAKIEEEVNKKDAKSEYFPMGKVGFEKNTKKQEALIDKTIDTAKKHIEAIKEVETLNTVEKNYARLVKEYYASIELAETGVKSNGEKFTKEELRELKLIIKKYETRLGRLERQYKLTRPEVDTKGKEALTSENIANRYWDEVLQKNIDNNEAIVIGADDLKDYFGKDYVVENHAIYSKAAFSLFEKAVDVSTADTVKFTVGGTGSGKSDFAVPNASEDFNGVIYDSTGFKYQDGLKKQIEYAESKGKKVKIYGIIPDLPRTRAYTFAREDRGEHPVNEGAYIRTNAGAIQSMISAIKDGHDVYVLDARGLFIESDIDGDAIEFEHNPLEVLEGLGYTEEYVKQAIQNITRENFREIISKGKERVESVPQEDRATPVEEAQKIQNLTTYTGFFERLREGNVSAEEFKQAFADFVTNKEAIKADLGKLNKDQLLKRSLFSRSSDNKASIIDQVLSNMGMRFALGRPVSYTIGSKGASNQALINLVEKTTQEDIDQYVIDIKDELAKRAERIEEFKKSIDNPETLSEFETFIEVKGKENLSAEQLVKYEDLIAIQAKEKEAKQLKEKGVIAGVKTDTTMTLEETTNTKTGEPLFKVKMADRVSKEQYQALNTSAKKLGGYYSTFAKGFLFKEKASAETFMEVGKGESVETTRPEEMKAEKEQNTANKLRDMADKLETVAEEKLNRDRKTNTARRANMANGIEEDARKEIALAKTMRNLANAIASGDAKLLNNLSTKTQIMELDRILASANYAQTRESTKETGTFKTDVPIDNKTVEYVKEFIPQFWLNGLEETANKASDKKGLMRASKNVLNFVRMTKAGGKDSGIPNKFVMEDITTIADGLSKEDVNWQTRDAVANFKRLQSLGIESLEQLKATLREYIQFKETPASADKVAQLERNIVGKKVGIDFFPTPTNVAERMVDMASIEEGMKVLEPSAGNGNIADAIRETGVSPDVAEISSDLRGILEAKGYNVVANDFMDITEKYDRIIMNPPFSDNMDIEHVKKAYELLNEGGKVVSIVGEGAFFRQGKKETEFRKWLDEVGANIEELPQGTFLDTSLLATTGTNARIIEITKQEPKYKLGEVTLKTLDRLGDRKTVSKQFIADLARKSDIKLVEKKLIEEALLTEENTVVVADFKKKVLLEVLPITIKDQKVSYNEAVVKLESLGVLIDNDMGGDIIFTDKDGEYIEYDELSPEAKEVADIALGNAETYEQMSGTRYKNVVLPENTRGDVADYREHIYETPIKTSAGDIHFSGDTENYFGHTRIEDMVDNKTRRVIEVQSDLYQKGNLEREADFDYDKFMDWTEAKTGKTPGNMSSEMADKLEQEYRREIISKSKLAQYNDPTAHFRMVREEIKKAAQDSKAKIQFPTGETAMKIEGLGDSTLWALADNTSTRLMPDTLKVGREIVESRAGQGGEQLGNSWIITDVLGDGKFKALPKQYFEEEWASIEDFRDEFPLEEGGHSTEETFDISGKLDTSNPIYKFYENDLGKYLKNKYGATLTTDPQGITWWEVAVTPEMAGPVEAFKLDQIENVQFNRTLEEIKTGLNKIFGRDVPLEEVFDAEKDLGNPDALARALKNNIKLLSQNKSFSEVIANHEGWHWFKMQLSAKEQAEIREIELAHAKANPEKLEKIRKVYEGIINTEAGFAEELMADTLAEYTKTGKTTVEKIQVWFDKLITTLKLLFSGRRDVLRMFRNIKETLNNTTGNNAITNDPKYKLDKNPEFNTGDKLQDAKLALEAVERRVGAKPVVPKVKVSGKDIALPEDLQMQAIALDMERESFEENPLNLLWKYANKAEGKLPEIGVSDGSYYKNGVLYNRFGKKVSKFTEKGDKLISDNPEFIRYADSDGNIDTERVREAFSDFVEQKKSYKKRLENHREMVKEFVDSEKDEIALQKLAIAEERKNLAEEKLRADTEAKKRRQEAFNAGVKAAKQKEEEKQKKIRTINAAKSERVSELSTWDKLVGQKLNPLKYTDKITQNIFSKWNSKLLQGEARANIEAKKFDDIPVKGGIDTILKYEAGETTPYSKRIKETFDALRKEALERDVDLGFRANYLPHVYAESPKEISEKIRQYLADKGLTQEQISEYENGGMLPDEVAKTLKINPFFSKERIFPTYKVAMEYGLTPKYTTVQQLVGHYVKELETIVANNELVQELESAGKILPFEEAPALTWQMVNLPFSKKGYMAPPNVARVINGLFGMQEPSFWTYMAKLSKKMQEIKLSAGIPYTTVNFFAIGQLVKEITAGNFRATNAFFRANFDRRSMNWLQENRNYIYMMARQGIDLRETIDSWENLHTNITELNITDAPKKTIKNIFTKDTIFSKTFDEWFSKKTFMSFMPMMQVQLFKDVYTKFIEQGYPADIAEEFAGRVISKNFGISKFSGRSKVTRDKLSAVFFAPTFREGIINTLANTGSAGIDIIKNIGGLRSPLDPTLQKNRKLLAGMIITYALYNLLNAILNDDGDDENGFEYMWDNPKNRQFALQIPTDDGTLIYVEFMPSFLAFARNMFSGTAGLVTGDFDTAKQKLGSVLSMPIKTATEIWGNQDYFNNPIYKETDTGGQVALKVARHMGLSVTHPYVTEIINQMQDKKPLYQSIIIAMELPLKFSSKDKVAQGEYYDALDKKAKENARMKEKVAPVYDKVQKLKDEGKINEAKALFDTLTNEEKIMYNKIKQNPYERKQEKNVIFEEAMAKIESGKSLGLIENQIAKEIYGDKPTNAQKSIVIKDFALYREFSGYKYEKEINEFKALSNENKVLYMKALREKISDSDYKEFIKKGRKSVVLSSGKASPLLISDEVLKQIR